MADDYDKIDDPGMLRGLLRRRDELIAELRGELDEQTDVIKRFDEYEEDCRTTLESHRELFQLELDDGGWSNGPFLDKYNELADRYSALVKRWNRNIARFITAQRDVGRPLAASEAQVAEVFILRKMGRSLRDIVEATSLTMRTLRTIIDRDRGTDRTTRKRREKIEKIVVDKIEQAHWRRLKRDGTSWPKRAQAVIETGQALVQEAKGLGRGGLARRSGSPRVRLMLAPSTTPTRLIVTLPTGAHRRIVVEIVTGPDGRHQISYSCWNGPCQIGRSTPVPASKAAGVTALVATVRQAIGDQQHGGDRAISVRNKTSWSRIPTCRTGRSSIARDARCRCSS